MKYLLFILSAFSLLLGEDTLMIASAKGYKKPMMQIIKHFETKNAIKVTPIFGNMRQVITQTKLSKKVVAVVGDKTFLENASLSFDTLTPLGKGTLVLAYPKGKPLQSIDMITKNGVEKIAIPDPQKAIYGKAATQYLKKSVLYEKVQNKLLTMATVPQISSYLITGEVDAGFINLTDALSIADKLGGYIQVDKRFYAPIDIVFGIVKGHEKDKDVEAFAAFLESPQAQTILRSYGL